MVFGVVTPTCAIGGDVVGLAEEDLASPGDLRLKNEKKETMVNR